MIRRLLASTAITAGLLAAASVPATASTTPTLRQLRSHEASATVLLMNANSGLTTTRANIVYYSLERRGPKALIPSYRRSLDKLIPFLRSEEVRYVKVVNDAQATLKAARNERIKREQYCRTTPISKRTLPC